ncbi:NACHT domain-containing protein [Mycena venus]|uniref:NACHT domain-containing protein n=1 Tax=Mycena venus TaxID=2733690 RepID=A0A8H7CZE2_9AGAR|nr:NACHT domain-containing protein [Mycena venus]
MSTLPKYQSQRTRAAIPALNWHSLDDWELMTRRDPCDQDVLHTSTNSGCVPPLVAGPNIWAQDGVNEFCPAVNATDGATAFSHRQQPTTVVDGGTFIGGDVNYIQSRGDTGLHILHRAVAGDAFHNSAERYPQPKCHPETRTEMLGDLWKWCCDNDPLANPVLWLNGPAGSGKSAIAQSFCETLEGDNRLGGSFFFKRGHASRGRATQLFSTIAYQLASHSPELKKTICCVVEDDPSILHKSLSIQLHQLIIESCGKTPTLDGLVIVIDGLDECESQDIQQEILRLIGDAVHRNPGRLRFLIASRLEPHICEIFEGTWLVEIHRSMNIQQAFEDIHCYLQCEFARIRREHTQTMASVSGPWPSLACIDFLVNKSSGYFIYASTVIKFLDDKHFRPTERLAAVMGAQLLACSDPPFRALNELYTQILSGVPQASRAHLIHIFAICMAKLNVRLSQIEQLLELKPGDVPLMLRDLHSIVELPPDDSSGTITVHHASLLDFLADPLRSGAFHVGSLQQRIDLAQLILKACACTQNDLSYNYNSHVAWQLLPDAFTYLTALPSSADVLFNLKLLNPDFLFCRTYAAHCDSAAKSVIQWLRTFRPLPEDLIRRWEDYHFMGLCDTIWADRAKKTGYRCSSRAAEILSQASRRLLCILYAYTYLPAAPNCLSWDELSEVIAPPALYCR